MREREKRKTDVHYRVEKGQSHLRPIGDPRLAILNAEAAARSSNIDNVTMIFALYTTEMLSVPLGFRFLGSKAISDNTLMQSLSINEIPCVIIGKETFPAYLLVKIE